MFGRFEVNEQPVLIQALMMVYKDKELSFLCKVLLGAAIVNYWDELKHDYARRQLNVVK